MKRVKITEEQLHDLSRREAIKIEEGDVGRKIAKMRKDASDMKHGELRQLAHKYIDDAFRLGQEYAENIMDIELRAQILKKLQYINKKIDLFP